MKGLNFAYLKMKRNKVKQAEQQKLIESQNNNSIIRGFDSHRKNQSIENFEKSGESLVG